MRSAICAAVLILLSGAPLSALAQTPSPSPPSEPAACSAAPNSPACAAARACASDITGTACRDGLRAQTYESAQWALQNTAAAAMARVGARFGARNDSLGRLVRARETSAERLRALDQEMVDALVSNDLDRYAARREASRSLQATLAAQDADLAAGNAPYMELVRPRPLSLSETQELLRPNEVLLVYLVGERATFAWAITRETSTWRRIDLGAAQLAERVRRLRADLDTSDGCLRAPVFEMAESAPTGVFDFALAYDLYQRLVQPFASTMAGKTRVLVAPSGPLMSLPFGVLVAAPTAAGPATLATLQRAQWLGIRYAMSTLPAPSSLRALRCPRRENGVCAPAAGRPAARRAFVGYGDPTLGGGAQPAQTECRSTPYAAGGVDQATLATLAPLPGTRAELEAIRAALGAAPDALRLGADATERRVRADQLEDVNIVVFATHGVLANGLRGAEEAGLVFTPPARQQPRRSPNDEDDGYLTVSEAAELRLGADWVVLSACNTALEGRAGGEGLSGLTRAFIYAGARAVLVSHWPVNDAAAPQITARAILYARDPEIGRAEALRRAMEETLQNARSVRTAHPSFWAPFSLVGEGA